MDYSKFDFSSLFKSPAPPKGGATSTPKYGNEYNSIIGKYIPISNYQSPTNVSSKPSSSSNTIKYATPTSPSPTKANSGAATSRGSTGNTGGSSGYNGFSNPNSGYWLTPEQQASVDSLLAGNGSGGTGNSGGSSGSSGTATKDKQAQELGYTNFADYEAKLAASGGVLRTGTQSPATSPATSPVQAPINNIVNNNIPKPGVVSYSPGISRGRTVIQGAIDSINTNYTNLLKEQEEEQRRQEGMARASAARGGDLQSSAYSSRSADMQKGFQEDNEALAARQATEVAQMNIAAETIAQNWANIEISKQKGEYDMANSFYEQNRELSLSMIQSMGAAGTSWDELSPEDQQGLMQSSGMYAQSIKDYMTVTHATSLQSRATPHIGADGTLTYSVFEGDGVKELQTGITVPQGATGMSWVKGVGLVYMKNGAPHVYNEGNLTQQQANYEEANSDSNITAAELKYQREQQALTGKVYIDSMLDFMTGNKDINGVSGEEAEFINTLFESDFQSVD